VILNNSDMYRIDVELDVGDTIRAVFLYAHVVGIKKFVISFGEFGGIGSARVQSQEQSKDFRLLHGSKSTTSTAYF
jgi:hypothetical protein